MENIEKEYKLISRLIGYVRATEGNEDMLTFSHHQCVIDYLNYFDKVDDTTFNKMLDQLLEFKKMLVPGCFQCKGKCGRTDDYDMTNLNNDAKSIKNYKLKLIEKVKALAQSNDINKIQLIYRLLYAIGGKDWEEEYYLELLNEC